MGGWNTERLYATGTTAPVL